MAENNSANRNHFDMAGVAHEMTPAEIKVDLTQNDDTRRPMSW